MSSYYIISYYIWILSGYADICAFLLKNGANPLDRNASGSTCLHLASAGGHSMISSMLASYPLVDLFDKDDEGI